jgi:hypothetical protein
MYCVFLWSKFGTNKKNIFAENFSQKHKLGICFLLMEQLNSKVVRYVWSFIDYYINAFKFTYYILEIALPYHYVPNYINAVSKQKRQ